MSASTAVGRCPGALAPMRAGDGLLVRVKPFAARLEPRQARTVAELAARHGNGTLELTSRANLQLRGVTEESHGALVARLRALGLVDEDIAGEARRNVLVTPLYAANDGTLALARRCERALASADWPALPAKFGIAIDTAAGPCLRGAPADIRLERRGETILVRADGACRGRLVTSADAPAAVVEMARWFAASGGGAPNRRRMSAHLAAGAALPVSWRSTPAAPARAWTPAPGALAAGRLLGLPLGRLDAAGFGRLAALGPIRLTPWRLLLVEGLTAAPDEAELVTRVDDPRLRVVACSGAPACLRAERAVQALAHRLAPHVPRGRLLHVSGCPKGCAHPRAADAVLTATPSGFDLAFDAAAGTPPATGAVPTWFDAARGALDAR